MSTDWREDLVHYLVTAGTVGRRQSEVTAKFQGRVLAATVEAELQALEAEEKVQHFVVPAAGRGARMAVLWRATTKMVEGV